MARDKQVEQAVTKDEGVKVGSFKHVSLVGFGAHGKLIRRTSIIVLALVFVAVATLVVLKKVNQQPAYKAAPNITPEQYSTRQVKELKANTLPANASKTDQIEYYSALVKEEYRSGQYSAGLADYKQLEALMGSDLGTDDSLFLISAKLYEKAGDKQAASAELAKARVLESQIADPILRNQFLTNLDQLQADLNK